MDRRFNKDTEVTYFRCPATVSPAEVHMFAHEERCLGPILRHNDCLAFTDKSKNSSSFSQMYKFL